MPHSFSTFLPPPSSAMPNSFPPSLILSLSSTMFLSFSFSTLPLLRYIIPFLPFLPNSFSPSLMPHSFPPLLIPLSLLSDPALLPPPLSTTSLLSYLMHPPLPPSPMPHSFFLHSSPSLSSLRCLIPFPHCSLSDASFLFSPTLPYFSQQQCLISHSFPLSSFSLPSYASFLFFFSYPFLSPLQCLIPYLNPSYPFLLYLPSFTPSPSLFSATPHSSCGGSGFYM
jgi:hypothetical protein